MFAFEADEVSPILTRAIVLYCFICPFCAGAQNVLLRRRRKLHAEFDSLGVSYGCRHRLTNEHGRESSGLSSTLNTSILPKHADGSSGLSQK